MHLEQSQIAPERSRTSDSSPHRLESETCYIEHLRYHCAVYLWLSQGQHRNSSEIFFVYMEYRDATRACRYQQRQFSSLQAARRFITHDAPQINLPDISGRVTRLSPIKLDH